MQNYANDSPQQAGQAFDPTLPEGPQGKSTDASNQGTLRRLWDNWTSRPENNAAMINFGLQMMQPITPGQSRLGHFAEAVGAGAEASQRNVAAQEERTLAEQKADLAERAQQVKEEEGSAYSQYMRNRNTVDKLTTQKLLRGQADWNRWRNSLGEQENLVNPGASRDPVVLYVRNQNPLWAKYSKGDIINDPGARAAAEAYVKGTGGGGGTAAASGGGGYPEGTIIKNASGDRMIMQGGAWKPLGNSE